MIQQDKVIQGGRPLAAPTTEPSINMQTGGGNRPLSQYVVEYYSAGMKVSMMPCTVPSAISSASAALNSSKMGLSLANAMA